MTKTTYFDNAATTFPKPECVYKEMDEFYRNYGVNAGRGQYKMASIANKLVSDTRDMLLDLFHTENKKVVFSHSATESLNIILQGLILEDNLNVYISPFEHNAVTRVLHALENKYKINIQIIPVNEVTLEYDLLKLKQRFITKKPNYMIVSHASNVCGVVAPINELCKLAKEFGCVNIIDMSQTAGLIDIDISSNIFDFCVFAGHKTLYGPFGIAGFICSNRIKPVPLMYGGTGSNSTNQEIIKEIPSMYEVGSPNIMAIAGLNAALKWQKITSIEKIYKKEKIIQEILIGKLKKYDNINIIGNMGNDSIGVVSVTFAGYTSQEIGRIFSDRNIAVRTGLHCSPYAHRFLNTFPAGTVRFSLSYFNDEYDIEQLEEVLNFIEENT